MRVAVASLALACSGCTANVVIAPRVTVNVAVTRRAPGRTAKTSAPDAPDAKPKRRR